MSVANENTNKTTADDQSNVVDRMLLNALLLSKQYELTMHLVIDCSYDYICVSRVIVKSYDPDTQELTLANSTNSKNVAHLRQIATVFTNSELVKYPSKNRCYWSGICTKCLSKPSGPYNPNAPDGRFTIDLDITDSVNLNRFVSFANFAGNEYFYTDEWVLCYKPMTIDPLFHPIFTYRNIPSSHEITPDCHNAIYPNGEIKPWNYNEFIRICKTYIPKHRVWCRTLKVFTPHRDRLPLQTSEPISVDIQLVKPKKTISVQSQTEPIKPPTVMDSLSNMYSKFVSAFAESFTDSYQRFVPWG